MRNFFIGSIGQPNEDYGNENFERCIKNNGHFMNEDTKMKGVFNRVSAGSIFILKYNDCLIAYGEVTKTTKLDKTDFGDWNYIVYVDKWYFFDDTNQKRGVNNYGVSYETIQGGGQMATIKEVTQLYGIKKIKEINDHNELFNRIQDIDVKPRETNENTQQMENVELHTKTLGQIFQINESIENRLEFPLSIPDYQRIYCWTEKNVHKLLDDIVESENKTYHLGSVILHKTNNTYAIVDGQQRLVTLSLLLLQLQNEESPLLNETFESTEAQAYIAYNKTLIKNYVERNKDKINVENLLDKLQFSVLIINDGSLDLAYTFFSNQNSRGKSLTDYDLLKAHHLRYVHIEKQAIHLAERWDNMVLNSSNDASDKELGRTFGIYLFRMRKWMRKKQWSENQKFKVKTEFEAASTIVDVPPFGEKFHYYESIQGGAHFFAYADHYIYKFRNFSQTPEFISLNALGSESHWWYKDAIETLLFAYYLKFGTIYLSEALFCIEQIISEHRYGSGRSSLRAVLEHASNSEIVMMIDQATSPTFFLAETLQLIKKQSPFEEKKGIQIRYYNKVVGIQSQLKKSMCIDSIVNLIN